MVLTTHPHSVCYVGKTWSYSTEVNEFEKRGLVCQKTIHSLMGRRGKGKLSRWDELCRWERGGRWEVGRQRHRVAGRTWWAQGHLSVSLNPSKNTEIQHLVRPATHQKREQLSHGIVQQGSADSASTMDGHHGYKLGPSPFMAWLISMNWTQSNFTWIPAWKYIHKCILKWIRNSW